MDQSSQNVLYIFRQRATRYAFYGTLIAILAVIAATLLLCTYVYDGITYDNIMRAHRENIALWMLDAMPFLYAFWGQYASMKMAREAGSMVQTRTRALRMELERAHYTTQAKTDFFARMSHELRTPINAIMGMSELLIDAGLDDRHQRNAQVIHESAEGLLQLINDVLDFSQIESGRMELDEVEFDIQDTLKSAATLLARQAEKKGLRLVSLIPPDAPRHVVGDPGRLRQVLLNLLGNAIKYTEEGEVVLTLRNWSRQADDRLYFEVEVADTGQGISKADQARLFQAYQQASTARQRRDSTGLGLSISKELVEAMGGEIGVSSAPGKGSVFHFSLSLEPARKPEPVQSVQPMDLRGTRVLLVETASAARDTLADQLRTLGMQTEVVEDGEEALSAIDRGLARGTRPDLVLTDIFLARLSGEELGTRLKSDPHTQDICLSVITAAGARGDAKRFNDIGFSGYLTRPIPPEHLGELLAAILSTRDLSEEERHRQGLVTRYHVRGEEAPAAPILLVDDSEIALDISASMLGRLGWSTETARSGEEALAMASRNDYALVVSDLQLPDLDGDELVGRIRSLEGRRGQVPIVMLTAGADPEVRQRCLKAGANDWLTKPVGLDTLRAALERQAPATSSVKETKVPEGGTAEESVTAQVDPRLAGIFLKEMARRLEASRVALNADPMDLESIARNAHALKGSSQHVGGGHVPTVAHRVEKVARAGDTARVREYAPLLEKACRQLAHSLKGANGATTGGQTPNASKT